MTPPTETPTPAPERVRVMARMDPDLHAALSEAANDLDWSTNSALNEAVRGWLERRDLDSARLDSPDHPDYDAVELRPTSEPGRFRVAVDGFPVPHLAAARVDPPQGTSTTSNDALGWHVLILDDRYQTKALSWGELWPMVWFMANAMAISAGYTSHGPNANRLNPHGPPEEASEFALWADRGWVLADASGSGGHTYELNFTFRLPAMDDADLRVHAIRYHIERLIEGQGGRDVCTRTVALRPLQAERSVEPVLAPDGPIEIVVNGSHVRVTDEPLAFHHIAAIAHRDAVNGNPRITYHLDRPGSSIQAELPRGGVVRPLSGMVFSVMDAD